MGRFFASLVIVAITQFAFATGSLAATREDANEWAKAKHFCAGMAPFFCSSRLAQRYGADRAAGSPFSAAAPTRGVGGTYALANYGADLEPGEPREGGKMTKTVWGKLVTAAAQRIVIHTYQTDFDTLLAVYTGPDVRRLKRVTGNDDRAVPGAPAAWSKHSLVQFNTVADKVYSVQVGSKTGAEGYLNTSVYVFPPTGGLSAFLAEFGGSTTWSNREASCGRGSCSTARFILHNSTNKTLSVTPSTSLGAGVGVPAPFQLLPGQVKTAQFTFTPAFDTATPRTVSGFFTFIGRASGADVTRVDHRAIVAIDGFPGLGNVLRADVTPTVQAGSLNEARPFLVKLTNTGAQNATGCHTRSHTYSWLHTSWQWVNPTTGAALAPLNQPVVIPAGQTKWLRVTLASQESRVADPEFPPQVTIDCANTDIASINLSNIFDLTALGIYRPLQMTAAKLAPAGDILSVPAAGGVFRVSAKSLGATAVLRALATYLAPFGEPANKQFTVKICRTAADGGACLQPPSAEVNYTHAQSATAFFKVFVTRPAVDPGFDPAKRRVFFKMWQPQPTSGSFPAVVAAESVAVRRN